MLDATMIPSTAQDVVPLTKIKTTLTAIWQHLNEARRANGKTELTRSSVMTLVAFAPDPQEAAWLHDAIVGLTGQHPSRAIILWMVGRVRRCQKTLPPSRFAHLPAIAMVQWGLKSSPCLCQKALAAIWRRW